MFNLYIPLINEIFYDNKEKYIKELKKIKCKNVILGTNVYVLDENKREKLFSSLKINIEFLHKNNFKVIVWFWSFMVNEKNNFLHIVSPLGTLSEKEVCPSDEKFIIFVQEYVTSIAKLNPDMLLFDDDFGFGFQDCGLGCCCENNKKQIEKILDESIDSIDLKEYVLKGGKNKYRSAFLKANKYFLENFASKIRSAVDKINPSIRFGICSCMDVWDISGISAYEIGKILAGNTRPFIRLIGAPYWGAFNLFGNRLQDAIDLERMEISWETDGTTNYEIICEGDVFPRPRYAVPSSYLEIFDMNMRVDGRASGIQKYTFDYTSSPQYETGYNENCVRNEKIYKEIAYIFDYKKSVGINVYESMKKYEDADIPEEVEGTSEIEKMFFSVGSKILSSNGIPLIHNEKSNVNIILGENARNIDLANITNSIIDLSSAEILQSRGIDVGLVKKGKKILPKTEYYFDYNEYVNVNGVSSYKVEISDKADIKSQFVLQDGNKEIASYQYQNNDGQKFLVYCFNMYFNNELIYRNYCRPKQIIDLINNFFNEKICAYSLGNPDLYLQCKKSEYSMAVSISNCSAEHLYDVKIKVDKNYSKIYFINCKGKINGDSVIIKYLSPFSFNAFEIK